MKVLHVKIVGESKSNQLLVSHDPEIENYLVFLRNPLDSKIIYSVNFNGGELLLGLDGNRRINRLELNYSRRDWIIVKDRNLKPDVSIQGCLEFININSRNNEIDIPLVIQTDDLYSGVKIDIGIDENPNSFWIALSDQCFTKIADNHVNGFWISLHPTGSKIDLGTHV